MGREQGFVHMGRVYGPDLMLRVCEETAGGSKAKATEHEARGGEPANSQERKADSECFYPSQDEAGALDLGGGQGTEDGRRRTEDGYPSTINHQSSTKKMSFTHFLYGSTPEVLEKLKINLEARFPGLQVVGTFSPPFRPLNDDEEMALQKVVGACKPDFFWVGLSTPKQERFMASHSPAYGGLRNYDLGVKSNSSDSSGLKPNHLTPKTSAPRYPLDCGIMLGVGAAFDIHAGLLKDAPEWVKNSGLQWFYRLCQEPRRLWRRYIDIVPRFLWLTFLQVMGVRKYSLED